MVRTTHNHRGRRRNTVSTQALAMLGIMVVISMALPSKTSASLAAGEDPEEDWDDFDLACDVKSITSSREDLEVGSLDQSPSESPSMSLTCSDAYSNTRGEYTSKTAPCVIIFHNENALLVSGVSWNDQDSQQQQQHRRNPNRKRDDESGTFSHYYHGTSSVCGIENAIGEAKEYVTAWPDECVGDFARCYDLADPNHTMCPALHELLENRRNRRTLEVAAEHQQEEQQQEQNYPNEDFLKFDLDALVPPGTTHISVDCTIDKEAILENLQQQQEFKRQRYRNRVDAQKEKTLFAVASILGAVLITIYALSQMVVQPIVGVLRETIGRNNNNNNNNNNSNNNSNNNNIGYGGNNYQLVSRMVPRTNSGLRIETDGDEFGMQDEIQTFHEIIETTIDSIPMDFDAVPIAPSRSTSPQQQQHQQQQQQQQQTPLNVDTVSVLPIVHVSPQQQQPEPQQIPMDFDAVPIVPATIIPIDAIHAEVVQDGVTYYP